MLKKLKELAEEYNEQVVAFRRDFHTNPEISWKEVETTRTVASFLEKIGCENIRTGFGDTECGVAAEIQGSSEGPCVALRADMDALPLDEENDVPYRSASKGAMHACGHDAHTAMLLGAAMVLSSVRDQLKGKVRLIFQPAEEHGLKSGADHMIHEGVLEGVDVIAGLHVWSPLRSGKMAYRSGPVMASCDAWEAVIQGRGGHGSAPHMATDPTIAAANIISSLQSVVGREIDPLDTAVISTGKIHAGSAFNIIPDRVDLLGTTRSFRPEVQDTVEKSIGRLITSISEAYQCRAEYKYTRYVPSTINDEKATLMIREIGEALLGAENVEESPLIMGSEDFSYFQRKVPGTFFFLGTGNPEKGTDNPHHSPHFNVDEDVLVSGVTMLSAFAWRWLASEE